MKNASQNPQLDLLELLYENNSIVKGYNISSFMNDLYPRPGHTNNQRMERDPENVMAAKNFLIELRNAKYIAYEDDYLNNQLAETIISDKGEVEILDKWFDNSEVKVKLTFEGFNFLTKIKISKSNLSYNEASRNNFTIQNILTSGTIAVALLSLCFSIISWRINVKNDSRFDSIQKEMRILEMRK
ncbi:hypothetical protein [Pedobacter alluvionis]|uniref:Uncharacterized protein n=1 Tax=Pedobacter alluvionis TaxID=475253 RepID=A0A497XL52_9SPHI|nr:hypothetical protein [Pedobacter alluvionis]RLJ69314.1 hypothetical protein BCL90_5236 [Pedobacter alluvionis]TFB30308.1 hypothetical protein E3V97_19265 [Pedobacter alluvionis]